MNNTQTQKDTFYIYHLSCPITGEIRYVGATVNPTKRNTGHCDDAKRRENSCAVWVKSLLDQNLRPVMTVIETASADNWQAQERFWINHFRKLGCELTNTAEGGITRAVWQCDLDGNRLARWDSLKQAGDVMGIYPSHISKCCNEERGTAGKYKWEYVGEGE